MASAISRFIGELRRRKVFRVLVVYAVVAAVLVEVAAATFEPLRLPDFAVTLVIVLAILGLPIALVLAWAREVVPAEAGSAITAEQADGANGGDATGAVPSSIAVLPFTNMSPDPDQGYFCEGLAEEIINTLSGIGELRVASRTSSFRFSAGDVDIREIGRQLNVSAVLEGSLRKDGDQLRLTASLVNVANGYQLWAERFDRRMADVFAIQDEIADNIARALQITLSPGEITALRKTPTADINAYDYYLRGRKFFYQTTAEALRFAEQMFSRAIELDPDFALAHAGLADCYSTMWMWFDKTDAILEKAHEASLKALALDPELAEAHVSRGLALSLCCEDEARQEFETAILLNPELFEAHLFYARDSLTRGDPDRAAQHFARAGEIDPEDYQAPLLLGQTYRSLDRRAEAREATRRGLEVVERHVELNPDDTRAVGMAVLAFVVAGEKARGVEWADRVRAARTLDHGVLYNLACAYAMAGETQKALDCLEENVRTGAVLRRWMDNDPDLHPLRDHPRFRELIEKLD